MKINPPKRPLRFLRWFCREDCLEEIEGDLTEIFLNQYESTPRKANWKFTWSVIKYFRPEFMKSFKNSYQPDSYGMYKNYFKITVRHLLKQRLYTTINIGGLAIGMAVAVLIGLWVFDELNFNRSFKNYDRLGSVNHHVTFGENILTMGDLPAPMGAELKTNYAEFEETTTASWPKEHIINYDGNIVTKTGLFVEPSFIKMFSVPILKGTDNVLKEVHSIVLAKSLADDLLGDKALGSMVKFDNRDNFIVEGIFEDFPANSDFAEVKMLLPLSYYFSMGEVTRKQMTSWNDFSFQCFVLLHDKTSFAMAEQKMKTLLFSKGSEDTKAVKPEGILLPMERWHLYSEYKDGQVTNGKVKFVWMFSVVGIFVLLLACINFMNLSTARSEMRSKEVGIRKVMGSVRNQLVGQFLSESLVVVVSAFVVALIIVTLCLPWFNDLAAKRMSVPWSNPYFIFSSLAFILITSALAGSYPALYLSSFKPVNALKKTFNAGRFAALPRKALVVFQFAISTAIVITTVVVYQQIQHAKDRPLGFDREGVFHVAVRTLDLGMTNYNTLREELLSTGVVENMAKSDFPTTGSMYSEAGLTWQGKDPAFRPLIAINSCSHDFPKANGFQFVAGRDFSREFSSDSTAVIVNEMMAKLFPDENVIGKKIKFGSGKEKEIIGVIKDQIRWSPFTKQSPHLYFIKYEELGYLTIRVKRDANIHEALIKVETVVKKHDAGAPFEYKFIDDDYARLFNDEERIGKLATVFAALTIFISCIGIFGLAAFAASQRTKEIGIRKVLGASVFNVWKMLSRDFAWLVLFAVLVASPLAYYFADQWLQQYDYRIEVSYYIFAVAGIALFVVTTLTVSYQSIKAAMTNPVDSLRSE